MRYSITCLILFFLSNLNAQSDCFNPASDSTLLSDNIQVSLSSTSDLFLKKGGRGFSMPLREDGKKIPLFSSAGLWIGGKDAAGNLKVAATIRDSTLKRDFHPGPLDDSGQTSIASCASYDRIWKVEGIDIAKHITLFKKVKADKKPYLYDSIPMSIKTWPAKGNPFYYMDGGIVDSIDKKVRLSDYGANFTDIDNDGNYNPLKGDYPSINQHDYDASWIEIPEVIYFWVFNDNIRHYATGGESIQMHVNAYAYKFKTDNELNDCIYFSYYLINKADSDIRDTYVGMFFDPSMGCPLDDKVAFDTLKNTIHFYNGHKTDNKSSACVESSKLGDYPYSISVDYKNSLRVPKIFARDNEGKYIYDKYGEHILIDPTPGTGDVDALVKGDVSSFTVFGNCDTDETGDCSIFKSDIVAYNLLRGLNYNGEPILHNELPVKKMFTGNPSEPSSWTMGSDSSFTKKNISCMMSVGPLLLQPGSLNRFDFSVCLNPLISDVPDFNAVDFNMPILDAKYYYESIDERGLGLENTTLKFETLKDEAKIKMELKKKSM